MPILWWILSVEDQKRLMIYQWENYGFRLTIPPFPKPQLEIKATETFEQLEKSMRRRPYRLKKVR